jgi:hypothetical protein
LPNKTGLFSSIFDQGDLLQSALPKLGDIMSRISDFSTCRWHFFRDTLWLFNIAMGNGPFIDGLPIKNGDFPWLC